MEERPVLHVFDGVVRSVVATPPWNAFQVAALIEVLVIKLDTGRGLLVDEPAFEQSPTGRGHGCVDGQQRTMWRG
jgi:hypothetical protein